MVNLMYLIIACHYLIVRGKTPIPKKEDKCKSLLAAAGCDDGKLLDKNVCIRKDYNRLIPPTSNKVYIKFSNFPQILGINEAEETIDMEIDMVNIWEDDRIQVNLVEVENEKLIKPRGAKDSRIRTLPLRIQSLCTSSENDLKIWTPQDQGFHVKGKIKKNDDVEDDPWGIEKFRLRLTIPLNETTPLIAMKMKFSARLQCKFHYIGYPLDREKCSLRFNSKKAYLMDLSLDDPDDLCNDPKNGYERNGFYITVKCFNESEGSYQVGIDFNVDRVIIKHVFQYYLPSAMIVLISQTSFVFPLSALPGRTGLVVTQFLALTNIFINEQVNSMIIRDQSKQS